MKQERRGRQSNKGSDMEDAGENDRESSRSKKRALVGEHGGITVEEVLEERSVGVVLPGLHERSTEGRVAEQRARAARAGVGAGADGLPERGGGEARGRPLRDDDDDELRVDLPQEGDVPPLSFRHLHAFEDAPHLPFSLLVRVERPVDVDVPDRGLLVDAVQLQPELWGNLSRIVLEVRVACLVEGRSEGVCTFEQGLRFIHILVPGRIFQQPLHHFAKQLCSRRHPS